MWTVYISLLTLVCINSYEIWAYRFCDIECLHFFTAQEGQVYPPNIPLMNLLFESWILGFHSREKAEIEMEIFQYRKSRIWEMKEDKYMRNS